MADGTLIFDTQIDDRNLVNSAKHVTEQFNKMQASTSAVEKGVSRATNGIRAMGTATAATALKIGAIAGGIGTLSRLVNMVTKRAMETSGAFQEFKAEVGRTADALARVADPILRLIMPAVQMLTAAMSEVANAIASVLSKVADFFGIAKSSDMGKMAGGATKAAGGIGRVGAAAKKATKDFASFDTIVRLGQKHTNKFGGGGGAGGMSKSIGKSLSPIGKMSRALKDLTAIVAGLAIGGKKGAGIASVITGIAHAINDSRDIIEKGFNTKNLTDWIADIAEVIGGGALAGGKLGAGVAALFSGLGTLIMSEYDKFKNGENWHNVLAGIAGQAAAIFGAWALGGKRGAGIAALFTGMGSFLTTEWNKFKNGPSVAGIVSEIKDEAVSIAGAWAVGGQKAAGVTALFEGMFGFLVSEWNRFKNGNEWKTVVDGISQSALAIGGAWAAGGTQAAGAAALFTGMVATFNNAYLEFQNGIDVPGVIAWIEHSAELILGAGLTIGKSGGALASIFTGALGSYNALHDALAKGFNISNITQMCLSLGAVFAGLTAKIGGPGAAVGTGVIGALVVLIEDIRTMVKTGPSVQGWLKILTGGLNIATAAFVAFNLTNPIGWLTLLGATIINLVAHWKGLGQMVQNVAQWFRNAWSSMAAWFESHVMTPIQNTWNRFTSVIIGPVQNAYNTITNIFGGLERFFSNVISGIRRIWSNFMSIFRSERSEVSSSSSRRKRWSTYSGPTPTPTPDTSGIRLRVPRLASGTVIPPNNPYIAVVGDQTSGTNVETPLSTIVEALKQALAEQPPATSSAVIEVDGQQFGTLVYKYGKDESNRIGASLLD
jgi:hypothetical protein